MKLYEATYKTYKRIFETIKRDKKNGSTQKSMQEKHGAL